MASQSLLILNSAIFNYFAAIHWYAAINWCAAGVLKTFGQRHSMGGPWGQSLWKQNSEWCSPFLLLKNSLEAWERCTEASSTMPQRRMPLVFSSEAGRHTSPRLQVKQEKCAEFPTHRRIPPTFSCSSGHCHLLRASPAFNWSWKRHAIRILLGGHYQHRRGEICALCPVLAMHATPLHLGIPLFISRAIWEMQPSYRKCGVPY